MVTNNPFPQPISQEIWERKYKLTTPNPDIPNDESVQDTWNRIAKACANAERTHYYDGNTHREVDPESEADFRYSQFLSALQDFRFLPAGRPTAGAGSGRDVTLFNCYVMGTVPDDMGGIFDMLKEAALTMQQGGGIGYDFSTIRPKGAPVKGVDADASGPLSFMDCWDAMCRTIMSAGARRGAMMATLRDDHPDILDFITAKHEVGRLNMFNMSVMCTDKFMEVVERDGEWPLKHEVAPKEPVQWEVSPGMFVTKHEGRHIYKVVKARHLWDAIMENTYNHAEPGVLFIDRINKMNNLWYLEHISSTNPCGEQPLPPYGACLLGSINLTKMVLDPFTPFAELNIDLLISTTKKAVRILDSVIDISNFPLEAQKAEAMYKRRMGIGITGLADMLFMLNVKYGTTAAQNIAATVMKILTETAYKESIQLAREFGPCPATETMEQRAEFVKSGFMQGMSSKIKDEFMSYGIRNSHLTSIAPTGTISLYAGNVSSGIEPIFAPSYMRNVLEDDGKTKKQQLVEDYAILKHREYWENQGEDPQDHMQHLVTAQTLSPDDHLMMQAAVQPWIDSSISKTINLPKEISFEDFKEVYLKAYKSGCKGCTTYRPNDILGSVIEIVDEEPKEDWTEEDQANEDAFESSLDSEFAEWERTETLPSVEVPIRNKVLSAKVYKLKWKGKNFYVTISDQEIGGVISPFEIFINSQDMSSFQWITALTRMISSVFRRGGDISFIVEDLKSIMDPNGGEFVEGGYQHSFIAYLGKTIELHLNGLDDTQKEPSPYFKLSEEVNTLEVESVGSIPQMCPECSEYTMVNRGGCPVCDSCGYSKCG